MKRLGRAGVTISETLIFLPLFLFMVFGLLQAGQIGIGLIVVNYAAGSIARKVARLDASPQSNVGSFKSDFEGLMVAGLEPLPLSACCEGGACSSITNNVVVTAQVHIPAFPVVGPMIDSMSPHFKQTKSWAPNCTLAPIPAVGFTGPPRYYFIVRGMAVARMNYRVQ